MRRPIATFTLLSLAAACGSAPMMRLVETNPGEASVYINGEKVQSGMALSHPFDFSNVDGIWLQVACPGYKPSEQFLTAPQLEELIRNKKNLVVNMQRR